MPRAPAPTPWSTFPLLSARLAPRTMRKTGWLLTSLSGDSRCWWGKNQAGYLAGLPLLVSRAHPGRCFSWELVSAPPQGAFVDPPAASPWSGGSSRCLRCVGTRDLPSQCHPAGQGPCEGSCDLWHTQRELCCSRDETSPRHFQCPWQGLQLRT